MSNRGILPRIQSANTNSTIDRYLSQFDDSRDAQATSQDARNAASGQSGDKELVKGFYAVATDFYEYGWGEMFHFGARRRGMTHDASLRLHETYLALRMCLKPGDTVADFGCGIGGPARNIAQFVQCKVFGVTISEYQVKRAKQLNKEYNLSHLVDILCCDFMKTPFANASFDGVYTIEATCHTSDKRSVFSEAFRILKPGAFFVGYEWCTTKKYDANNEEHRRVRFAIEQGNGLPETASTTAIDAALVASGFSIIESFDAADRCDVPWYEPLNASFTLGGFRHTRIGSWCTHMLVSTMERVGMAPQGSSKVSNVLLSAAQSLCEGGKLGIYTPMYCFVAQKPMICSPTSESAFIQDR